MCDYKTRYFDLKDRKYIEYMCPHDGFEKANHDGKEYCIFHRKEDRDIIEFENEFKAFYESGEPHEFIGFIFPENFDLFIEGHRVDGYKFKNANFRNAVFLCDAKFVEVEFSGDVGTDFGYTEFRGVNGANFRDAKFIGKGVVNFSNTKFLGTGSVDFHSTLFSCFKEVSFHKTKFTEGGSVSFTLTRFEGNGSVSFDFSDFSECKGVFFIDAEFSIKGNVYFQSAHFSGNGIVRFSGKTFYDDTEAFFSNVEIGRNTEITFKGIDLNHCRFLETDLQKINFKKVFWRNRDYDSKKTKKRTMIYDEMFQLGTIQKMLRTRVFSKLYSIKNESKNEKYRLFKKLGLIKPEAEDNHYDVHLLYSKLRMNYEQTGRQHEAGDFFIGEMEMRRTEEFEGFFNKLILILYKYTSLYGERPLRVLMILVGLIVLSGLVNLQMGVRLGPRDFETYKIIKMEVLNPKTYFCSELRGQLYENYPKALSASLSIFTLKRVESNYIFIDENKGPFILAVQVILFAIFISLFILAMNRKFRRRKD